MQVQFKSKNIYENNIQHKMCIFQPFIYIKVIPYKSLENASIDRDDKRYRDIREFLCGFLSFVIEAILEKSRTSESVKLPLTCLK